MAVDVQYPRFSFSLMLNQSRVFRNRKKTNTQLHRGSSDCLFLWYVDQVSSLQFFIPVNKARCFIGFRYHMMFFTAIFEIIRYVKMGW